ncbi:hypothetical protein BASA60_006415 [Batrachochytrium salamandrivorans]|nr:hypothetical protein BASA60_006415 [Batrachochytrium salamandrivorans]
MDSKLAADLQIPLLELSTPITLRLADGDSSSSLNHRTVPLQLHIGKHVETATFYSFRLHFTWLHASRHVSFVKVSPVSDVTIPPDILPNFSLLLSKDQNSILTHRPGKLNSQTNSLSCREDYKATSESFNFQQILTSTGS